MNGEARHRPERLIVRALRYAQVGGIDVYAFFLPNCQVPDDYILKNKRPLLISRKVLGAIVADWKEQKPSC